MFAELFDARPRDVSPPLIPTEMAAKLLRHEKVTQLTAFEAHARAKAAAARSDQSRDVWTAQATKATTLLKQFPTWKTLYRKLKQNSR